MKLKLTYLAVGLLLCSCSSMKSTQSSLMRVKPGMTKQEVISLLGEPKFRRFDLESEELEFNKVGLLSGENTIIVIHLVNGRVVNMDSFSVPVAPPINPNHPTPPTVIISNQGGGGNNNHRRSIMSSGDFQEFHSKVKSKPFKEDKVGAIRLGVTNKYLTCEQCQELLDIFLWDDDKLSILTIVAPRLADLENSDDLVDSFGLSAREKARKELLSVASNNRK